MKINIIDLTVTSAYDGKPSFALCRQEGKPLYRQVREKIDEDELNLLLFPPGTRIITSFYYEFFHELRKSQTVGWIKEHFTVNVDRKSFDMYIEVS